MSIQQRDDCLQTFMLEKAPVRGAVVRLERSWQEILSRHDYPQAIAHHLGEAVAASVLLASRVKIDGSITMQTHTDGPLHTLVAQCTSDHTVRGLAHWRGDGLTIKSDQAFGNGRLVLTIDQAEAERYQGIVEIKNQALANVLEAYFAQSEQLSTRLWLACDESYACGLLLQALPDGVGQGDDPTEDWRRCEMLADTLTREELLSQPPTSLIRRLFHEERPRAFTPQAVEFHCGCSQERIEALLLTLGRDEVSSIIADEGQVAVDCEFCNRHYEFDRVDAMGLFVEIDQPQVPPTHH